MEEQLYRDVAQFVKANRKAFVSVEIWLNRGDWYREESSLPFWAQAWEEAAAMGDLGKILFIAWIFTDEHLADCSFDLKGFDPFEWVRSCQAYACIDILHGCDAGTTYQNERLIRKALIRGKEAGNVSAFVLGDIVLSKPMSKRRMMDALGIDSIETFNAFADTHGIVEINRSTHQIRLDKMDAGTRQKLEKA